MDGDKIDSQIIERIPTVSKRNELVEQIDLLLNGMSKIDTVEMTELGSYIAEKSKGVKNQEEYLNELKKAIIQLPVAELVIAFVPNNRDTIEIVRTIRSEIAANAVVAIEVNPHIIGGAIIAFEGKYFDGSLIRKIKHV
jgi:F0F1-type ATP synthase delta subunit